MAVVAAASGAVAGWALAPVVGRRHPSMHRLERPVLAAATGVSCAAMALRFDDPVTVLAFGVLCAGLVLSAAIDLHTRRLPREVTYATLAAGAPVLTVAALVEGDAARILTMAGGAVLALLAMLVIHACSRGGMGDGDVRFSPLLGAYLGWLSLAHVAVGLFLGFVFGAVVGLVAMAVGLAGRRTSLPFGPFLAAGTVVAVLAGQPLIDGLWGP